MRRSLGTALVVTSLALAMAAPGIGLGAAPPGAQPSTGGSSKQTY